MWMCAVARCRVSQVHLNSPQASLQSPPFSSLLNPQNRKPNRLHRKHTMSTDAEAIKASLTAYGKALAASDVNAVLKLYTKDGVVMGQGFPTQVGHEAVQKWYKLVFDLINLDVTFDFQEIVVVSDEYAFARTTSAGTQKLNATGVTEPEANQELFVMQKVAGEWKIARYAFSTTIAPKA